LATLVPHALPYVLWLALGAAGALGPWADPARVVLVAAALAYFARRGAYPELRAQAGVGATVVGVLAGLAVGAAWVPLAKLVPTMTDSARTGLDPAANVALTAFRIVGTVVVIPLAEELLVRSALPRFVDAKSDEDWRARPIGAFTALSAAVSVAFFALTHPEWLAALVTALVWTALLAKTRNLRVVVVSHAVANAWVAGHVLVTGETRWW